MYIEHSWEKNNTFFIWWKSATARQNGLLVCDKTNKKRHALDIRWLWILQEAEECISTSIKSLFREELSFQTGCKYCLISVDFLFMLLDYCFSAHIKYDAWILLQPRKLHTVTISRIQSSKQRSNFALSIMVLQD